MKRSHLRGRIVAFLSQRRVRVRLAAAALVIGLGSWARMEHHPRGPHADRAILRGAHGEHAALEEARAVKRGMRGLVGADRDAARLRAAAAFLAAARRPSAPPAVRLEACFRAGELLRAGGLTEQAMGAFHGAVQVGENLPLALRARLELAHIHRRQGRLERALEGYEALTMAPASPVFRDAALRWCATVQAARGRVADAARIWKRLAQGAYRPFDRVRAHDRIVAMLIDEGNMEGARRQLERCDAALDERASERTQYGEALRHALLRMASRASLRRASALDDG